MHHPPIPIKIKRFDSSLPLPTKQSIGAAALDMYARQTVTIKPGHFGYIPLNVALQIPPGYWVSLVVRSSTHKHKLIPANGIGVFDEDYCGDDDEYKLIVYNVSKETVTVERGVRIAQILVLPNLSLDVEEVAELGNKNRGGIGSTGTK